MESYGLHLSWSARYTRCLWKRIRRAYSYWRLFECFQVAGRKLISIKTILVYIIIIWLCCLLFFIFILQSEIAIRCASTLQKIVRPYLLRRKKDDLTAVTNLPPKTEQVRLPYHLHPFYNNKFMYTYIHIWRSSSARLHVDNETFIWISWVIVYI